MNADTVFESVKILSPKAGDIIVLKLPQGMKSKPEIVAQMREVMDGLRDQIQDGDKIGIVVVPDDLDVAVLRCVDGRVVLNDTLMEKQ